VSAGVAREELDPVSDKKVPARTPHPAACARRVSTTAWPSKRAPTSLDRAVEWLRRRAALRARLA
jgi:hypothetical protein